MNGRYRCGWFGESHRHYLAAKGISTKRYMRDKEYPLFDIQTDLSIKESASERQRRERAGFDNVVKIDARKFKTAFEDQHDEALDWRPERTDNLRNVGEHLDSHPRVTHSSHGIDVEDGRHRIALAAERGQKIDVVVQDDDVEALKKYYAFRPMTKEGSVTQLGHGESIVDVSIQRAKVMRALGEHGVSPICGVGSELDDAMIEFNKDKVQLESTGYKISPPRIERRDGEWRVHALVRRTPDKLREQVADVSVYAHGSDSCAAANEGHAEEYIDALRRAIASEDESVPLLDQGSFERVRHHGTPRPGAPIAGRHGVFSQGRHRIIAAERAGNTRFPFIVRQDFSKDIEDPARHFIDDNRE